MCARESPLTVPAHSSRVQLRLWTMDEEHDTEKIMRQMWNKDVCDGSGCGRCPTCPASKEQESE